MSVDGFMAEVETESARLREQIDAATTRAQRARASAARHDDPQAAFGALLLVAQRELDRIEGDHRQHLEAIGASAAEEAARVLESARHEAAAIRAASVAAIVSALGRTPDPRAAGADPRPARPAGDRCHGW